jgi:hypothetical protein
MKTLTRAFGGAFTPMMQFMLESHALSSDELTELEAMIRKKRRGSRERARK